MPTIKLPESSKPEKVCYSSGHDVPSMMVFDPGTYEHTCSSCGKKTVFIVSPSGAFFQ